MEQLTQRVDSRIPDVRSTYAQANDRSVIRAYSAALRRQFRLAAVEVAIALVTYRAGHGRYPDRLELLVPDYLPSLPADPYGHGEPLRYRQVPTEGVRFQHARHGGYEVVIDAAAAEAGPKAWVLYSVGEDLHDDGGIVSADFDPATRDDWLVRLPGQPVPPQPDEGRKENILGYDPNF